MSLSTRFRNFTFKKTLKACYLALSNSGGCIDHLNEAVKKFPISWVKDVGDADVIFVSGMVSRVQVPVLKDVFKKLVKPYFLIRIGKCFGPLNSRIENPSSNDAIDERVDDFFPFDDAIDGCPPSVQAIYDKLETFLTYLDTTPEMTRTLDKRVGKKVLQEEPEDVIPPGGDVLPGLEPDGTSGEQG